MSFREERETGLMRPKNLYKRVNIKLSDEDEVASFNLSRIKCLTVRYKEPDQSGGKCLNESQQRDHYNLGIYQGVIGPVRNGDVSEHSVEMQKCQNEFDIIIKSNPSTTTMQPSM